MRIPVFLIFSLCILVCAAGYSQQVSLNEKNTPLQEVLRKIEKQSGYLFWYESSLLQRAAPVNAVAQNLTLTQALDLCLRRQPLSYTIVGKTIVITPKKPHPTPPSEPTASAGGDAKSVDSSASSLDEVVLIGYGSILKRNVSGSISTITSRSISKQPVASLDHAIAGQAAGVYVAQLTGTPGGGATIRVRGTGSITAGNEPLYVIDGFPVEGAYNRDLNPLATIDPADIESIQILKDAASAAIYGSRGSNGVVLITTKKGIAGPPVIKLNFYRGIQQVMQKVDLLNATEYAILNIESRNNAWKDLGGNENDPDSLRPANLRIPAMFRDLDKLGKGTDWQDEIFRLAPVANHQLSVTGGNENTQYLLSLSYFDQEGIVINTNFQRYSLRFNLESQLSQKIKIGLNFSPSYSKNNFRPVDDQIFGGGIIGSALAMPPSVPVFNPDGSYTTLLPASEHFFGTFDNPVAIADKWKGRTSVARMLANAFAEWKVTDDLQLKTTLGSDYFNREVNTYWPSTLARNGFVPPVNPEANENTTRYLTWLNENTITYNKTLGNKHSINAIAGFTIQSSNLKDATFRAINFPNDLIENVSGGEITLSRTNLAESAMMSYLARANYNYAGRYLVTATVRRDGSSRFGPSNKWATFPSASIGWNVSREKFMQNVSAISDLRLRASYGRAGNNAIGDYAYLGLLSADNYVLGRGVGTVVNGIELINLQNDKLRWEVMKQLDVGLDLALFRNRLMVVADYYHKVTSDLILDVPVPASTGFARSYSNIGKILNKGWEFTLTSLNTVKAFKWRTDFNISFYKNKVLALGPEGDPIITMSRAFSQQTHKTEIGSPIGSFYGYEVVGVYRDADEVAKGPKMTGTDASRPGDLRFKDLDGNGLITPDDRKLLGDNAADLSFGITNSFSYRNFSLSLLIDGVQGIQVLNGSRRNIELTTHSYSRRDVLGRWRSPENPGDGKTPRVNMNPTGGNVTFVHSHWIEDASFLRIRNIDFRYTFPARMFRNSTFKDVVTFFTVQNAFIISKYQGFNPEQSLNGANPLTPGVEFNGYPLARVFVAGFNIVLQ